MFIVVSYENIVVLSSSNEENYTPEVFFSPKPEKTAHAIAKAFRARNLEG